MPRVSCLQVGWAHPMTWEHRCSNQVLSKPADLGWLDFKDIFWMFIGRFDIQQPTSWYVDTLQLQTMSLYIVCVALFTFTEVPNVTRLKMWVFLYGLPWNLNAKALATKFCLHIRCHYGARWIPAGKKTDIQWSCVFESDWLFHKSTWCSALYLICFD